MPKEVTALAPEEEARFQRWARANQIGDVDHPDSYYDYRGYYQETKGAPHKKGEHFPDTYKQHGHPTFSVESKYSRGLHDGGRWLPGDTEKAYVKPPLPSHEVDAEGRYQKRALPEQPAPLSDAEARRAAKRAKLRAALKDAGVQSLKDLKVSASPVIFGSGFSSGPIGSVAIRQGLKAAGRYAQESVARAIRDRVQGEDEGELKTMKRRLPYYADDDRSELETLTYEPEPIEKLPYKELGVSVATAKRQGPVNKRKGV